MDSDISGSNVMIYSLPEFHLFSSQQCWILQTETDWVCSFVCCFSCTF